MARLNLPIVVVSLTTLQILPFCPILSLQDAAAATIVNEPEWKAETPIIGRIDLQANEVAQNDRPLNRQYANEKSDGLFIPIAGPLASKILIAKKKLSRRADRNHQMQQQPHEELQGCISAADPFARLSNHLDRLLDAALDKDEKTVVLDKAVNHYRSTSQKVIAEAKDATDYMIPYRGFGPSSEAGDIILGEKLKLKSRASSEYARQKHIDEKHVQVVTSTLQLAMGLGMQDKERGKEILEAGMKSLTDLVGEEEANASLELMTAWQRDMIVPDEVFEQKVWDVSQKLEKHKLIVETSLDEDPVVREIKRRIHKYNHKSKFSMVTSHVVQTTLGVASLTPSFVGPAAKLALLTYVMSTGGPESCKLLKELYLDKRFESRCKIINEEAHIALDNYQLALLTRNPVLLCCSESILGQMVGEQTLKELFGKHMMMVASKREPGA